jgi:glutamine synthetase
MDLEPFDPFSDLRREIVDYCLELGIDVKYAHAEVGPGQQEIEMDFVNPLKAADELQTMKQIVRVTADKKGYQATFLPKPFAGEAGNGLHIHQRLLDNNNESIFGNKSSISEHGLYYIGGLLKHSPAMTAFNNPVTNSFKRMTPGHEAPVYMSWGIGNRTALVRIPGYEESIRIEYRSADGASNIYLILALQLSAGLDGIANKINPPEPLSIDITKLPPETRKEKRIGQLPTNLFFALEAMSSSPFIEQVVSKQLLTVFHKQKLLEWDEYNSGKQAVTPWEFRQFLNYA